jgi:hypothetical protein
MAKKLYKTRIERDKDHMYYIKAGAIWAAPMKRKGKKTSSKKVKIVQFAGADDLDYSKNLYFIDKDGDVAFATRGRKKTAKKAAKKSKK